MQPINTTQFDPKIVKVLSALKKVEGGDYNNRTGDGGSSAGAYQWNNGKKKLAPNEIPINFQNMAKSHNLNPNDFSPANQNKVAYSQVKKWKDDGLQPEEIAALWNGAKKTSEGKFTYNNPEYGVKFRNALKLGQPVETPIETPEVEQTPEVEPEKRDGLLKSLIKAPATMIARPLQAIAALSGVSDEAINKFSKEKLGGFVAPTPQNIQDVKKDVGRGVQTVALGMPGLASGGAAFGLGGSLEQGNDLFSAQTAFQTALGAGGAKVLGLVGKPLLDVTGKVIGKITPQVLKDVASQGTKAIEQFASRHKILPTQVSKGITTGAKKLETVASKPFDLAGQTIKQLTRKSEKQIENNILKSFEKGVRPTLSGKSTPNQLQNYRDDVVSAVKTIKGNQSNLQFTDETGNILKGETPKSLQQLADAVEQTKKTIFIGYDNLAKQAGKAGVKIQTNPIVNELDAVINNKALQLTNPNAIKYAKATQARYRQIKNLDATTAQDVIQNYNKSLEAFYRNPTYDNATQAAIDAMIANNMRKALDEGITGLTGTQYSALKKQYGSLKSIEKDVIKASLKDAKKNVKGLIDFTDIFSGGQIVSGLISLSPGQIASGLTQKGIATFYKYLNNPNRAIEKMFSATDKLPQLLSLSKNPANSLLQTQAKTINPTNPSKNVIPKSIPKLKEKVKLPPKPPKLK